MFVGQAQEVHIYLTCGRQGVRGTQREMSFVPLSSAVYVILC